MLPYGKGNANTCNCAMLYGRNLMANFHTIQILRTDLQHVLETCVTSLLNEPSEASRKKDDLITLLLQADTSSLPSESALGDSQSKATAEARTRSHRVAPSQASRQKALLDEEEFESSEDEGGGGGGIWASDLKGSPDGRGMDAAAGTDLLYGGAYSVYPGADEDVWQLFL
jgi:hypothetical protein